MLVMSLCDLVPVVDMLGNYFLGQLSSFEQIQLIKPTWHFHETQRPMI